MRRRLGYFLRQKICFWCFYVWSCWCPTRRTYSGFNNNNSSSGSGGFRPKQSRRVSQATATRSVTSWRKPLIICGVIFLLYFIFIGSVSFVALSTHRSRATLRYQLIDQHGRVFDSVYGVLKDGVNSSLEVGAGKLGDKFQMRRDNAFINDILRSQTIFKCTSVHFRKQPGLPVALISFPGSGNTWLRYLLQLATGIYTGSIYKDFALLRNGFPGENITGGRVLVVKTHESGTTSRALYKKGVLLIRKPSEAILAEFNRLAAGHIGHAGRDKYTKNNGKYWSQFVVQKAKTWTEINVDWIENFEGPLYISLFSQLVQNTSEELSNILNFLEEPVSAPVMACVLRNKEGIYKRKQHNPNFNPFSPQMTKFLDAQEKLVIRAIERRITRRQKTSNNQLTSTSQSIIFS